MHLWNITSIFAFSQALRHIVPSYISNLSSISSLPPSHSHCYSQDNCHLFSVVLWEPPQWSPCLGTYLLQQFFSNHRNDYSSPQLETQRGPFIASSWERQTRSFHQSQVCFTSPPTNLPFPPHTSIMVSGRLPTGNHQICSCALESLPGMLISVPSPLGEVLLILKGNNTYREEIADPQL